MRQFAGKINFYFFWVNFLPYLLLFDQIYNIALETLAQLSLIWDMLYIISYTEQQHFGLLL